jgi:nucleotide-binding universal stress UspA family protein
MENLTGTPEAVRQSDSLRILVPLDDSIQAQRVLGYVKALIAATHGSLMLIRATDVEDVTSFNSLGQNAERLREAGLSVEWKVIGDVDAETAISTTATAWQPDLIALASTKSSGLDRWLNGSVTANVLKTAHMPVLVVPPAWQRTSATRDTRLVLVPVDGSSLAEQAVWTMVRWARWIPVELVLMRAERAETAGRGAQEYLSQLAQKVQSALPGGQVSTRVVVNSAATGILETARELDVDAITMSTRGHDTRPRLAGRTATEVFDSASAPLILLGPKALSELRAAQLKFGARVRSIDGYLTGEVHRVVVDLGQRAVVSIVVLTRGGLARDILVPVDFVQAGDGDEVQLRLTRDALEALPDFAYNEFDTPPATWTSTWPVGQHKRLTGAQHDVTRETQILAMQEELGRVERVEWDRETGGLDAFWVRRGGVFRPEMRIPAEWAKEADDQGNLLVAGARTELEAYLGYI